jgi:hypothetical protein
MKWPLLCWFVFAAPLTLRAEEKLNQVLEHVPEEAGLVIVAPSLGGLIGGLAEFGRSIGVAALGDLTARKLLNDLDVIERTDGLDLAGPFLIALAPTRSSPLLVCTVSDAEVWRAASGAQPVEAGLWRLLMFGEPAYAACEGKLLIVADEAETVRAALRGGAEFAARFGPRAGAWLADSQLVLAIKVPGWTSAIAPAMGAARASLQISMMISGQQDENMLRLVAWFFDQAQVLLGQVETYTAGVRIGAEGVFYRDAMSFKLDGSAAAYLRKVEKTERNLLRGLLDDEDVCVFAYEWELPPEAESMSAQVYEALLGSGPLRQRLGENKFQPAYRALLAAQKEISGASTAISAAPTEPLLLFSGIQFSPQPQVVLDQTRQAYETAPEFISAFGAGTNVEVAWKRERIDSLDAYAYEVSFATPDEQARRVIETLYGRTLSTYSAAHPQGVAYTTGAAERATAQLARMMSADGKLLAENPRIQEGLRRLSPNPQMLVFLDLPRCLELAIRIARLTGAPLPPIEFSQTPLPLVSYGGYLDGNTLCGELYVPAAPLKEAVSIFQSVKQRATSAPVRKH